MVFTLGDGQIGARPSIASGGGRLILSHRRTPGGSRRGPGETLSCGRRPWAVPPAVPEAWLALPSCSSAHVRWRGCCRRNLGGTPPRLGALLEVYAQVKAALGREGWQSVKPSAKPTLVRTQHLLPKHQLRGRLGFPDSSLAMQPDAIRSRCMPLAVGYTWDGCQPIWPGRAGISCGGHALRDGASGIPQGGIYARVGDALAIVQALGVDAEQDFDAVPGALGHFCGRDSCVQPQRDGGMA